MSIWEKIVEVLTAPFTGVYEKLDEVIDNAIVKWVLYLAWCFTLGWVFGIGAAVTYLMIRSVFCDEEESE